MTAEDDCEQEDDDRCELPPEQCESCGGTEFGRCVFGFPYMDEEMDRGMKNDTVRPLGCIPGPGMPCWYCMKCDTDGGEMFRDSDFGELGQVGLILSAPKGSGFSSWFGRLRVGNDQWVMSVGCTRPDLG